MERPGCGSIATCLLLFRGRWHPEAIAPVPPDSKGTGDDSKRQPMATLQQGQTSKGTRDPSRPGQQQRSSRPKVQHAVEQSTTDPPARLVQYAAQHQAGPMAGSEKPQSRHRMDPRPAPSMLPKTKAPSRLYRQRKGTRPQRLP